MSQSRRLDDAGQIASAQPEARRRIVISTNSSWNIANFREGLIRALILEGYEVLALAPLDGSVEKLEAMGCRVLPINMNNKGVNPLQDALLFVNYWRLLRQAQPAAYLGYTIKPNVYGSLAAQALGIPVINNISGLGTAFIRKNWLTAVVKRLYHTALKRSHKVFFQNEEDRSLFVENDLVRLGQTGVLAGSGINVDKFAPTGALQARSAPEVKRFLLIARLLRDKGIVEYVEAARRVRQRHPAARFGILGFLDVENRTAISRAEVDAWVAEGVIEYLGATDDVRPFIEDADCVVLPSYREGTPRTLLEAAAMGKPLIATDVPGCRNVVMHETNGYLCRAQDADDLADQLERFIALPEAEVGAMSRNSRDMVLEKYDERLVIAPYLDTIGKVAQTAGQ